MTAETENFLDCIKATNFKATCEILRSGTVDIKYQDLQGNTILHIMIQSLIVKSKKQYDNPSQVDLIPVICYESPVRKQGNMQAVFMNLSIFFWNLDLNTIKEITMIIVQYNC